ncbi:copper chaperone PCu(A)C [Paracoccus subflavus]|uniref:Copper chaperone PCu(A)C n=1 Tax=Paracoccus subflavus TaxID=2528244 RepID=A0A4Q9GA72_9RHOB|nr:copper chaperone PCu(A)C [Paracoccus subflavus]TBN43675.1 copper chaperone PCu(A)C [Paracoccus subflavus]
MKTLILAFVLLGAAPAAFACESVSVGGITVQQPWSRVSIGTQRPGVLYLTIRNDGPADDALTAVSTPAAETPMLHETVVSDGIASMPHVMQVPVPAGETVELRPGGYHGMLMGLTGPLEEGATFPVTLTFATAGEITIPVQVLSMRAEGPECDDGQ